MEEGDPEEEPKKALLSWLRSKAEIDPKPFLQAPQCYHEGLVSKPLRVLLSRPGRIVCSFRVPRHLANSSQFLHEGVIGSLVDDVGAAAFITLDGRVRMSVDINVSYMFPARIGDEVEIEAKVLKYGTPVGVVLVVLNNKTTGQMVAQGRHTMYYPTSKL